MNKPMTEAREYWANAVTHLPKFGARRSSFAPLGWFLAGAAIGSAAMYLLDPTEGKKRRSRIRDRGVAWKNDAARLAQETGRNWRAGIQNMLSKISSSIPAWKDDAEEGIRRLEAEKDNPSYLH